ncbi:MAG: bcp [Chloroflexi bacterium]|nr:bcp [Chloroflexota bacterium]
MAKLKAGDAAPDVEAVTDAGQTVRLSDFKGKKVIVYFYPRDDTPGCTTQACGFRDSYSDLTGKNAVVLGVSPQGVASHKKFKTKYSLPFPLLVDEDHKISEAFGVWEEKTFMGRKYLGVVRSHFVIDEQGQIADARYNVKAAASPSLALGALG